MKQLSNCVAHFYYIPIQEILCSIRLFFKYFEKKHQFSLGLTSRLDMNKGNKVIGYSAFNGKAR